MSKQVGRPGSEAWRDRLHGVPRNHDRARRAYDRASRWYEWFEEPLEGRARHAALRLLTIRPGERVLDVGCGPGAALVALAHAVGPEGRAVGLDLSPAMAARARARLDRAGLLDRAEVHVADATSLPWPDGTFDALLASFTLELFDTPEIPAVANEWRRVLRPGGRIAVVALSRNAPLGWPTRAYEWLHDRFPETLDCRPIHPGLALETGGFQVVRRLVVPLFGLRAEAVLGVAPEASSAPRT